MKPKRILIAGGGPAGLEAACCASVLGHSVLLYDKEDRIGGQLWEASVAPTKGIMRSIIEYYQRLLQETNVELHLSEALTIETLQQKEVDVVIMATGSTPIRPTLPGVELAHVVTARDVLLGDVPSGESILVVGGGLVGSETAEFLAAKGKQVQLIEMLDDIVMDVEPRTRVLLLERLDALGVKITTGCRLKSIERDNATVELQGQELMMPADLVVLAVGSKANDEMTAEIKKGNWETYVVGDAHTPGNIKEAVRQGFHVILETLNDVTRSQPS